MSLLSRTHTRLPARRSRRHCWRGYRRRRAALTSVCNRRCALGRANVGFDEGIGLGQPDRCPAIRTGTSRLPQWPGKAGRSAPSASSSRTLHTTATEAWPIFSTMWSPTAWSNGPGTLGQAAQPHPVRMRILARSCERGRRLARIARRHEEMFGSGAYRTYFADVKSHIPIVHTVPKRWSAPSAQWRCNRGAAPILSRVPRKSTKTASSP